jgi:hypothetical protein
MTTRVLLCCPNGDSNAGVTIGIPKHTDVDIYTELFHSGTFPYTRYGVYTFIVCEHNGDAAETLDVETKAVYPCLYQRHTFTASHAHVTVLLSTDEQVALHKSILDPVSSTWDSKSDWSELLEADPVLYTEMMSYVKNRTRPSQELAAEARLTKAFVMYMLQSPKPGEGKFYWSAWNNWKHLSSTLQTDIDLAKMAVQRNAWDVRNMPKKLRTNAELLKFIKQSHEHTYNTLMPK